MQNANGKVGRRKVVSHLDAILDQALDDFENQDLRAQLDTIATPADSNGLIMDETEKKTEDFENMRKLLSELDNPDYGETLQSTLKSLSTTSEGIQNVDHLFSELAKQFHTKELPDIVPTSLHEHSNIASADRQAVAALQMLGNAQEGMEGMEATKIEEAGETMMQDMMAQFEALGEKEDYNEVIDGVMRQLLSRDLMYEPIKQVCRKFPEWLALHKSNLSDSDYMNYGKQYQVFQRLLAVYETEPENFPRLIELMFEMQEYGQPPADIIRDLAPGLQFDENGMPIMPNMGAGMMPETGPGGLPNIAEMAGAMGGGQCSLM